jgi:hypothetical protein
LIIPASVQDKSEAKVTLITALSPNSERDFRCAGAGESIPFNLNVQRDKIGKNRIAYNQVWG